MNPRISLHIHRARRVPRVGVMLAAALAGVGIGAAWHVLRADGAAAGAMHAPRPALPTPEAGAVSPAITPLRPEGGAVGPAPAPTPAPLPRAAAPSVMVAPGVHVTPMSVPAGTVPEPAGPRPHDSEPEN